MDPKPNVPETELAPAQPADEPPPLGSWPRMYALVLGVLALDVVLFYLFTRAFQ